MADNTPNKKSRLRYGNFDTHDLTTRFEHLLSARRMTELAERARSRSSTPVADGYHQPTRTLSANGRIPPPYSSLRNIPKVATPPHDHSSQRFRSMLIAASTTPCKYENPGLLDEALRELPLERIYAEADEESQLLQAQAASISDKEKPQWGYQDCVIRALLRYATVAYGLPNTTD
jgi:peptide-N4-(N-acetyl-beta-glucosaminyl)asparagine amidase